MSYESVSCGPLKLKRSSEGKFKKKKKKKNKETKERVELSIQESYEEEGCEETPANDRNMKTKAEVRFQRARDKKQEKELLKIASSTHKDRILQFNENLDKLTEHFDIPKVSWTK